jgi:hypothetical protein
MTFDFSLKALDGDFGSLTNGYFAPIKEAATLAMRDLAEHAKERGRANIAAAGFSKRWQNALRAEAYPRRKFSADAAVWLFHRIPYAGVFEEGATIRGRPRLWVPLSTTPKLPRRQRLSPRNFAANFGKLVPMVNARKPLLGAPLAVTAAAARKGPPYRVTAAALRRGASGQGIIRTVPVFVGVDTVSIRKRFDLRSTFESAADQIGALYLRNLKA